MPVQRVPRYNLLLQDLLKHTDESHPDYKKIQESLAKMNEVATKINESVRKSDNAKRIASLEAKGANFDVRSHFILKSDFILTNFATANRTLFFPTVI